MFVYSDKSVNDNTSFKNNIMQGFLKKKVEQQKLFQKQLFPRRFFKIQFDHGTIEIYKSLKVDDQDVNRIRFSEVVTVSTPTERLQEELVEKCSKKFQWPFFLYTEKRNFELYAQTE